ncbi:conserved hypothetical protein [Solidesulfovibrio fructosivorans JJ]]|uniref:Lipoprotein n=1 Tax=Solidesulfovibrio fructosivorans JJ] TaxID=596151 RepID=E1JZI8_SOLFR|nr:hypothetical protein [Solidesulfovibrio fructosivorans]EFL50235.1 conserved hypothetical protein [Solidesulfovibrio fructosivorans JJ]]
MSRRLSLLCLLLSLVAATATAWAGEFDCAKPPYGKPLADVNDHDYFVKFMEKDGVTYYNYTGPCRLGVHERLAPVIVYGVVDGKLYGRIMRTEHDNIDIIKQVTTKLAGTPETETEGDWLVMSWDFPEKKMKMKLKYNNATKATKSAVYYEPLRPKNTEPEDSLNR